jgi:phospho-N-acetylmuramoyl-pentapeptide-transferase
MTVLLGKVFVPFLTKLKYNQPFREIGPLWHNAKRGTPTMGGIMLIAGVVISSAALIPFYYFCSKFTGIQITESPVMITKIFSGIVMASAYCGIGFIDDYLKVRKGHNLGLNPKQKLVLQFITSAVYLVSVYLSETYYIGKPNTFVTIPFFGSFDFKLFYWPFVAILIVGIVNATNLTDGVDGLCASISFIAGLSFIVISKLFSMLGLAIEAAALAGGSLGFLVWNFHPAKVFMGDTGSFFLGGIICALGLGTGNISILIIISAVYILEMFSIIIQMIYFKITHGKRLFKMSPVHHHFEMLGFKETKICAIFASAELFFAIVLFFMIFFNLI